MNLADIEKSFDVDKAGRDMHSLMRRLYPICRSITGNGVRKTLDIVKEFVPIEKKEVPSGEKVFDWTVPREWNIDDAFIMNSSGERVVDFRQSNLHVVSYSVSVNKTMKLVDLRPHLYTLPDHPDWIPYRTAYYAEDWGFCLSHHQLEALNEDETYTVVIESSLEAGHLTYGEYLLSGQTSDEVLLSCHVCHPSMCNDNLSGIVILSKLAQLLRDVTLRYSYRMLFIPGTIGSITWLALNEHHVDRIKHGLVVSGVGDPGALTYKKSRQEHAEIDRIFEYIFSNDGDDNRVIAFSPYGYDERQYCSPGFDLPVGCLQRTPFAQYPEYHTSADNCDFVKGASLGDTLNRLLSAIHILESNSLYRNTLPKCEPQLGRRGLYGVIGGQSDTELDQMTVLWVLNLCDGRHTLLDIAERSEIAYPIISRTADILLEHGLLDLCNEED
jgi:aminopeptidase-like protein